jgi:hypothetical protein
MVGGALSGGTMGVSVTICLTAATDDSDNEEDFERQGLGSVSSFATLLCGLQSLRGSLHEAAATDEG